MSRKSFCFFSLVILFAFFTIISSTHAAGKPAEYTALAPISTPGNNAVVGSNTNLGTYFSQMYQIGVGVATALAVLMVIWGGVQYVTTDAIGGKEDGKERIQNAILGLVLALGSYLILKTINPALLNTNLNIKTIETSGASYSDVFKGGGSTAGTPQGGGGNNPSYDAWGNWTDADQRLLNDAYGKNLQNLTPEEQAAVDQANLNQAHQDVMNEAAGAFGGNNNLSSVPGGSGGALLTSYGYAGDLTPDGNSAIGKGNNENLLTDGSVALSPDVVQKLNPKPGAAVYVGGTFVGYYDDKTAASYKGTTLTNRVDVYNPSGSLGGNNYSQSSSGQITVDNNNVRPQTKFKN